MKRKMPDGQVVFEIDASNKKLKQALSDTTSAIEHEGKKWDKAAGESAGGIEDKFTSMFKKISAAAVAAKVGKTLLDWGKQAIQAASDLEEVQNVVDVTFGEGASKIEAWAKKAGTQFGLTETQAKRFTSTLGAMMKSAGMAGPEIVEMSTDLAGLAADMASFYNLDFDTAFQKIRSGISGETEPLKQLGINMSVANLEAFALTQGITKAFNSMSQGEQTMLRYQYLMQATSDAQGDFARTSDGYANAVRMLETNIESLKTSVGNVIIPIVNDVVSGINGMISALTQTAPRTVLDDFADIDLKTGTKLAEIQKTADEANALIAVLEEIGGKSITSTSLTNFVGDLSAKLTGLDSALEKAKNGDYSGTISAIADAASTQLGGSSEQWKTLLTAISDGLPGAVDAVLSDDGQTAAFLSAAANAADDLGGEYPDLWKKMLGVLGTDAGAAITALANGSTAAGVIEEMAKGFNTLSPETSVSNWKALLGTLKDVGGISFNNVTGGISSLADALSGTDPNTDRAKAWKELLNALSSDMQSLQALTGKDAEGTKAWLEEMAAGANALNPESAEGWDTLLAKLTEGLPGLDGTQYSGLFEGLNGETDTAEGYLRALGIETDSITDKQKQWLEVCDRLVHTIPGLSAIINTETGEVKGGVSALREYVTEWKTAQTNLAMMQAIQNKRQALSEHIGNIDELRTEALYLRELARIRKEDADAMAAERKARNANWDARTDDEFRAVEAEARKAAVAAETAETNYNNAMAAIEESYEILDRMEAKYQSGEQAVEEYADGLTALERVANGDEEALTSLQKALTDTTSALDAVSQYYTKVKEESASSIKSVVKGFESIETPAQKSRREMEDLTKQIDKLNAAGQDSSGLQQTFHSMEQGIPSIQNMSMALDSQLKYLDEYNAYLKMAQANGLNADMLASLADGSQESYDYLQVLAGAGAGDVEKLNQKWQAVADARKTLTDSMTSTKLNADEEFQTLVDAAQAAAEGLNVYHTAENAMEQTVKGIADGIAAQIPSVQTQVDALNTILGGMDTGLGGILGPRFVLNGSHANGLDYVPFDNYLAKLHEGESILTAEEARVWRDFKNGGNSIANTIDYEAMGGVMRDNIKPGGNVYLDGRVVGSVLSAQQGNSLRALERSGWQG